MQVIKYNKNNSLCIKNNSYKKIDKIIIIKIN